MSSVAGRTNVIPPVVVFPTQNERRPSRSAGSNYNPDDVDQDDELTQAEVKRIHLHLGHASPLIILKTVKNAKRKVSTAVVKQATEDCGCEKELAKASQHSQLNPRRAPWAGHTIGMDTWFPLPNTAKDHPFIVIVDKFSRMAVSGEVPDETVQTALHFLSQRWIAIFGRPSRLITDNGSNFKGEVFAAFAGVWNIAHICNPAYSAYQGGVFERTVGMLKTGVQAITKHDPSVQRTDAASLAVAGRNMSPLLECGLAPLTIMTGRHNILDFATEYDFVGGEELCASIHVPRQEMNLQNILSARAAVISFESRGVVKNVFREISARTLPMNSRRINRYSPGKGRSGLEDIDS